MPYWPLGYPNTETSIKIIAAIARAGADMIELGVPFSDPLADGVVIQRATQVALANGITVAGCIAIAARLRAEGCKLPLFSMGYMNPIMAFGEARYVQAWQEAGVDGLIVPDLPSEDSGQLGQLCAANDMGLVQFAAPTSTEARLQVSASHATGFIYVVQVAGITGARASLASGLQVYVERVKRQAHGRPVVVGFGVSTAAHVRAIGAFADGAIVASALISHAGEAADPAQAAFEFVANLLPK